MKICGICGLLLFLAIVTLRADFREFQKVPVDESLGKILAQTAEAAMKEFPQRDAPVRAGRTTGFPEFSSTDFADLRRLFWNPKSPARQK